MKGVMQLYSVDKKISQPIEGHAGVFLDFNISGFTTTLIAIAANNGGVGKVHRLKPKKENNNNKTE